MRTRSGTRGARLRFAGAPGVLFIVGALLLPPGAGAHGGAVGHPEGHAGIGVSHGPGVLPSPIAELGNIALANGTFRTGNTSGPNGVGPTALAYDGIHHRLFVGVAGPAPGVIVIDPQTGDEVARWPVPGGSNAVPRALVFDPLNDLLDVAGGGSGNVSFLNAVTGAVENTTYLGVGTDPVALAVDTGTNVLAVAEASDASVALLNATSGSVTRVVAVGPTPDAVAFDPVLGWMIVANGGGSTVTLLDPGNGSTAGSEPVGNAPDGVAYDSVQGNVLVANRLSDNVTILSPGGLVPIGQYGTGRGPGLLSCTIDGQAVIPNTLDDNVTVVDDAHRTPLPSQPTGVDPVVSLWDASEGRDYIADQVTDNLTVLNLTVTGVEGSNGLGGRPLGIADLPGLGRFAFADPGTSAVEEVTAGNLSEVFRTTLPAPPIALAASEALGRLFAIEPQGASAPGNLSILDAGTGAVLGTYPVGLDPQGVAFDPATGEVYVAEWGSASVSVIDPLTGHVNATFSIPAGTAHPSAIAVAVSANGSELYVPAGTSNSTVTVLNATTGAFVAAVPTPSDPVGVADDPTNRTVWVADAGAAEVTEIAESGHVAMANFTLGVDPVGVAVDDPLQWVLVTSPSGHLVDLLNASDGTILGVLRVGAAPTGVAVDPTSVHAAVTDPSGGDVALLGAPPPTFPVTFQESGLPDPSAGWNLTVDGVPLVVTAASVTLP
ncbi:MAG TPA: YncE family protein, partial [Thermoplasmata archaeon]|nr:YncE family protein [Thermoplasmata archaeon]